MTRAKPDPAEAAAVLGRTLDAIERGELTAPAALVHRLEGAVIALRVLAGDRLPTAEDIAGDPPIKG